MFRAACLIAALAGGAVCHGQATTNPNTAAPPKTDTAATPTPAAQPRAPRTGPLNAGWWNDRVFYQVFVRSFYDSRDGALRNDGIGDIPGLIDKLDYLNDGQPATMSDLEVRGLWLMPIYPSPSYHGYDVTNYTDIAKLYGTIDDFKRLMSECAKRNIKVILDLVPNHTSSQHPWFEAALDPKDPHHDWYIWSETNPGWKGAWNQTVWHPLAMARLKGKPASSLTPEERSTGPFYFGMFSHTMPDLNMRNPGATKAMYDVVDFWLKEQKVDGFRLDAIRHLVEDGQVQENTPETYEWLKGFQAHIKSVNPDAMTVGEVWSNSDVVSSYIPSQMDLAFEFDLSEAIVTSVRDDDAAKLKAVVEGILPKYPPNQFATFLSNHDQTRVATRLKGDAARLKLAGAILMTLPGVPFVYYGEELGMTGDKPDEKIRTPMQWTDDSVAGFSLPDAWIAPNNDYPKRNVKAMLADQRSLLGVYQRMIRARNDSAALAFGEYHPVMSDTPKVYAFLRHVKDVNRIARFGGIPEPSEQSALVIINMSNWGITDYGVSIAKSPLRGPQATMEVANGWLTVTPKVDTEGGFANYKPVRTLPAHSMAVITMEPLAQAQGRPPVKPLPVPGTKTRPE